MTSLFLLGLTLLVAGGLGVILVDLRSNGQTSLLGSFSER